ncbi:MAG: hypothetical protein QM793_05060 [Muricomes sp.]
MIQKYLLTVMVVLLVCGCGTNSKKADSNNKTNMSLENHQTPEKESVETARDKALKGMTADNIAKLNTMVKNSNLRLEQSFVFGDMDYYLLRYGPEDVGQYVQDKSTVAKYYGMLTCYKQ